MPWTSKKARPPARRTTKKARRPRATQAERTATSHDGLLRATLELVAERGIRATSLQAIGERAGYSRGLTGHRFGSKEGLLRELMAENVAGFQAALAKRIDERPEGTEALKAMVALQRETMEERPEAVRAYYMLLFESVVEMPDLRKEFARIDDSYRVLIGRILRARIARGTIRGDIDPAAHANFFLAVVRGVALQWVLDPAKADPRKLGAAFELWLDGALGARGKRRR